MPDDPTPDAENIHGPSILQAPAAAAAPPAPVLPEVPGFEILGQLGEGGMGAVYKARQVNLDRLVAVKVINRRLLHQPGTVERFRREAHAAARLHHPNIVLVYHADQHGDLHFLVMEHVDGIDLYQLVRHAGALSVARAAEYARQTALGLQHAHEKGLVHRDIKPSNLMLAREGPTVKILDMGLALFQDWAPGPDPHLVTQEGVFLGSADWAAPEQGLDAHGVDHRADLYSLGCTLYFLLTARVPYPGGNALNKLERHRTGMPTAIEAVRRDVPPSLAAVVRRLMARQPLDRYASAAEAVAALAPFTAMESRPVLQPVREEVPPPEPPPPSGSHTDPDHPLGEIACWRGHEAWVRTVAFAPDSGRVYSAGRDGTIRAWEVGTGAEALSVRGCREGFTCLAVAPSGEYLLTANADHFLHAWDVASGLVRPPKWRQLIAEVLCLALSANGRYALTGGGDGVVRLWDVTTAKEVRRFEGHTDAVACVAFSPNGTRILSGSRDRTLRLWDVATGQEVVSASAWLTGGHRKATVTAVAFSPHGRRVLSAGSDHAICLWEVRTGKRIAKLEGHRGWVYAATFSPGGRHVLSGSGDKTVRLWDLNTCREAITFVGHTDRVTTVAFSPDGRLAASGGVDQTVRLWRLPE